MDPSRSQSYPSQNYTHPEHTPRRSQTSYTPQNYAASQPAQYYSSSTQNVPPVAPNDAYEQQQYYQRRSQSYSASPQDPSLAGATTLRPMPFAPAASHIQPTVSQSAYVASQGGSSPYNRDPRYTQSSASSSQTVHNPYPPYSNQPHSPISPHQYSLPSQSHPTASSSYVVPSQSPSQLYSQGGSPPSGGSQERYPCNYCDKTFSRNHDRKRHMETHVPGSAGNNRCRYCGKDYSRADSLKRHVDNGCDQKPR